MKRLYVLGLCFLSFGCSSLTHKKDEASVQKINKVAIVAFEVDEPKSKSLLGALTGTANNPEWQQTSPHIDEMYTSMAKFLTKNVHWVVMDRKVMTQTEDYVQAFDKTMKGFQNKMPVPKDEVQYIASGVMDADSPRILGVQGREALMKTLNVDAVVVARIHTSLNGFTAAGFGNHKPQAHLSFFVYARGQDKPVWFEGGIDGEESHESVGTTGILDTERLHQLVQDSSETAFRKIGKN